MTPEATKETNAPLLGAAAVAADMAHELLPVVLLQPKLKAKLFDLMRGERW